MKTLSRLSLLLVLVAVGLAAAPTQAQGGLPVATLACDQTLYSQPSETSTALAELTTAEPMLLITGRDVTGNWVVALRQTGQVGWLQLTGCVQLQGSAENAPLTVPNGYAGPPVARIACTQYIRSAPDETSTALSVLYPGDGLLRVVGRDESINGRNTTITWMMIEAEDGRMGWVYNPIIRYYDGAIDDQFSSPCIRVSGDVFSAPVQPDVEMPVPNADGTFPEPLPNLPGATIGCTQYIRSAPSSDSARLAILYPEDGPLTIIGRDRSAAWLLIQAPDARMGWVVDTECIVVEGDSLDAPITPNVIMPIPGVTDTTVAVPLPGVVGEYPPEETIAIPEPNVTLACANYVRSAADNASARLMILYPGDGPLEILARDQPGEWLLVRGLDGTMGWVVNTNCVVVNGNVFDAPQDTSVVMAVPGVSAGSGTPPSSDLDDVIAAAAAAVDAEVVEPTVAAPPLPYADVACTQYIRSAASNDSARLSILYPGDGPLEIIARDQPAAWLLVQAPDGRMGWVVNTSCMAVVGNVFDAPQDTSVEMTVPNADGDEPLPFPGAAPPESWTTQ